MSKSHTDSAIVEYHEDGSWTVTTVETNYPLTTAEKATGWAAVGALTVLSISPFFLPYVIDKWEERREARAEKKRLKSVK